MVNRLKDAVSVSTLSRGTTAEELRFNPTDVLPAEVAPLPSLEAMRLVSPKTGPTPTEVPLRQNPYHNAYTSRLDYASLLGFLQRFSQSPGQLDGLLDVPPFAIPEERLSFLKRSREVQKEMVSKLQELFGMMREVRHQMVSNKEG